MTGDDEWFLQDFDEMIWLDFVYPIYFGVYILEKNRKTLYLTAPESWLNLIQSVML